MNISSVFPEKFTDVMTCGEVFENLEYDEEEIKELTESFDKRFTF